VLGNFLLQEEDQHFHRDSAGTNCRNRHDLK
jgi:hypothetical protein